MHGQKNIKLQEDFVLKPWNAAVMFDKMWTFDNKRAATEKNRYKENDNAFTEL
jgi:hypothetical protein